MGPLVTAAESVDIVCSTLGALPPCCRPPFSRLSDSLKSHGKWRKGLKRSAPSRARNTRWALRRLSKNSPSTPIISRNPAVYLPWMSAIVIIRIPMAELATRNWDEEEVSRKAVVGVSLKCNEKAGCAGPFEWGCEMGPLTPAPRFFDGWRAGPFALLLCAT